MILTYRDPGLYPGSDTTKNFLYIRTLLHGVIADIFITTLHVERGYCKYRKLCLLVQLYKVTICYKKILTHRILVGRPRVYRCGYTVDRSQRTFTVSFISKGWSLKKTHTNHHNSIIDIHSLWSVGLTRNTHID